MSSAAERFRHFQFPGPVTAAFAADRVTPIRGLMGPQGGGKTVTVIFDALSNATLMPICKDDVIRFKLAVIRDTYGRLEETTIPTWIKWLPKDDGEWTGGGGRQAHHKLQFDVPRRVPLRWGREGTHAFPLEFEAVFAAVGDQSIEDFMRGFEVTAIWENEMDLLAEEVLTLGIGRIGRYPAVEMLPWDTPLIGFPGCMLGKLPPGYALGRVEGMKELPSGALYRDYIVGDLNAPDIDSWFYRRFEEEKLPGMKLYRQPGGREAKAENLHNLKPGYYDQQIALNKSKPRWIRRFVDCKYGPSEDGEPVYPEYSDDIHLAPEPLKPAKGIPLRIGIDAGIQRPAAAIEQWMPNGQWRMIGEVVPGRCGARTFARALKRWLIERAPGHEIGEVTADPAGFAGGDKESGELAWAETVEHELSQDTEGLPQFHVRVEPAPSNEIGLRLDAVRDQLNYMIDGTTPGFLLCPTCRIARKGFAGSYKYKREQVGNTTRTSDKPMKDGAAGEFSHVQDAKQYNALGAKGRYGAIENAKRPDDVGAGAHQGTRQLKTDFDVMSV